ncbi:hypothetical protein OC861_006020 [Tilletia horrida]|nr:hypothetical protein OC861_006020 [Tilletia horrida]
MTTVHEASAATPGLREGELLFFLEDDGEEQRIAFQDFFFELAESIRAGPLSHLLNAGGEGSATVTAVKASGMLENHPQHEQPCIALLFEDCWVFANGVEVYNCIQQHHPQFPPFGVKARVYSALRLYADNDFGASICIYTADQLAEGL